MTSVPSTRQGKTQKKDQFYQMWHSGAVARWLEGRAIHAGAPSDWGHFAGDKWALYHSGGPLEFTMLVPKIELLRSWSRCGTSGGSILACRWKTARLVESSTTRGRRCLHRVIGISTTRIRWKCLRRSR
jgi:hypothetical protein